MVFRTAESLQEQIKNLGGNKKVGFIPTMGALHHGHISLVDKAFEYAEIVVVSIFVNPKQFNKEEDLKEYPRNIEADVNLLKTAGKVLVFAPSVEQVYPSGYENISLELGSIATIMEGKYREGHFDGVINVVKRLFDIVKPDFSFFGLKDFQQLSIIEFMVETLDLDVQIIPCEIIREKTGLASSSRNERLSEQDKEDAVVISKALKIGAELASIFSPKDVKKVISNIVNMSNLKLEYIEIVDPKTLLSIDVWMPGAQACIAAYCGEVRLIDNWQMTSFE